MTTKSKVPQIRFKGFSGKWEEKKLGDIFNYERPDNYIVKSTEYSNDNKTPVLTANKAFILGYTNELNTFNKPSIIFDDFTLDFKFVDFPYMVKSSALKILTINDEKKDSLIFIYNLLHTIKIEIMGHARHYIGVVQPTNVFVPKIEEQIKIGSYFQKLDKLIQQKENKYQKLKQFKKAMLDKMFPKNGADTPEIRFKGFSGKWKEKRLEEIALIKTGYPFDSNKFDANGEYLVITNGNIQNDFSFVDNLLGNKINIEDKCSLTEYILNLNDILVTMDGTVGRVAKVIHEKQILAQRVGRIIALIDSDFVYYFLSTGDFFKKMKLISTGGTIKHISLNDISKYESYIPKDFEEQEKIGNYFQKLDKQIDLQQKELEKLKNIKKASLSKMFV